MFCSSFCKKKTFFLRSLPQLLTHVYSSNKQVLKQNEKNKNFKQVSNLCTRDKTTKLGMKLAFHQNQWKNQFGPLYFSFGNFESFVSHFIPNQAWLGGFGAYLTPKHVTSILFQMGCKKISSTTDWNKIISFYLNVNNIPITCYENIFKIYQNIPKIYSKYVIIS